MRPCRLARAVRAALLAGVVLLPLPALVFAQSTDGSAHQLPSQPSTPAPMVRLRLAQGKVSILYGDTVEFADAKANMPVLGGRTIRAGEDGQAEIELLDGSVVRLTPDTQLRLTTLPTVDARREPTDLELLSGLAYFELNTADGQQYTVHFAHGTAQPTENSIFRVDLDNAPELAVLIGAVRASVYGPDQPFTQAIEQGHTLRLSGQDGAAPEVSANVRQDSWDRWNQDRDAQIANEAEHQTAAGEQNGAAGEPGWNDLDYYGNWYPTEQFGNVWVPSGVGQGWDPYSSGYWADYPAWGFTWISDYPWGWLPYQCGAWNYWDSFGWGWIPGQCFFGAQPIVTIWNAPPRFHAPPRPLPSGHVGRPSTLLPVHRGPAVPATGLLTATHTHPVRIDGERLDPLPPIQNPGLRPIPVTGVGQTTLQTGRVGVPRPVGAPGYGSVLLPGTAASSGVRTGAGVTVWPPAGTIRPQGSVGYAPGDRPGGSLGVLAPRVTPMPSGTSAGSPRVSAPVQSAPRPAAPAPSAPHVSAPAVSAPHVGAGTVSAAHH